MKLIHKDRIPLKYLIDFCKIDGRSWDYKKEESSSWMYWLNILGYVVNYNNRKYNTVYIALNDDDECIGYLTAYNSAKRKGFHPILFLMNILYRVILVFFKYGRYVVGWRKMYCFQLASLVKIGKQYLAGKDYDKISEGLCVAVYPEYRKQGIYRNMLRSLMQEIDGFIVFQTGTESVYQAHEAIGFKKILEAPFFYPEKDKTFIMYGKTGELNGM